MDREQKKELEKIFRTPNSSNELFDCFRTAIESRIKDSHVSYKSEFKFRFSFFFRR